MRVFDELVTDTRYAARTLFREPAFVTGIVVTLALAISANAAMFGIVGRLLLSAPPGVTDARQVVRVLPVFESFEGDRYTATTTSYPAFRAMYAAGGPFTAMAAVRTDTMAVGQGSDREEVAVITATGGYFALLGAKPALGRLIDADDDHLPAGNPVAVLSYAYWQRHFDGDPAVRDRQVILDGQPFTIVGVAPPSFTGDRLAPVDLFVPLSAAMRLSESDWISDTHRNFVQVIARLRADASPASAALPTTQALSEFMAEGGDTRGLAGVELPSLLPGAGARATPQGQAALWLTGVAVVVLIIATANAATLLLLRALRRRREVAVRIALGVGPGRLARQLLSESLLLSLLGGAAGLLLSRWLSDGIRVALLPGLAVPDTFVDARMLSVTVITAVGTGLLAGLAPVVLLRRHDLIAHLRESASTVAFGRSPLRHVLVGTQVSLCTLLLAGAGLFVRSLQRVESQDLGFNTRACCTRS